MPPGFQIADAVGTIADETRFGMDSQASAISPFLKSHTLAGNRVPPAKTLRLSN